MSKLSSRRGLQPRLHGLRAGGFIFSLRAFFCLKQDVQDVQDVQDELQVR